MARAVVVPALLPFLSHWTEAAEARILREGEPLSRGQVRDAVALGVGRPQKVRLLRVNAVPLPLDPALSWLAGRVTRFPLSPAGMSLRYGIFIRREYWGHRHLVAHELVHTAQYECLGGHRAFLDRYLRECLEHGYAAAPLERDAVARSVRLCA
jgi:hypothetical protein